MRKRGEDMLERRGENRARKQRAERVEQRQTSPAIWAKPASWSEQNTKQKFMQ